MLALNAASSLVRTSSATEKYRPKALFLETSSSLGTGASSRSSYFQLAPAMLSQAGVQPLLHVS